MIQLLKRKKNDSAWIYRKDGFFELLDVSAEGVAMIDAEAMAIVTGCGLKHCRIVWDICMAEGVLRQVEGSEGYSALEWMIENGYYGDNRPKEKKQYKPKPPPPPHPSGPDPTEPEPEPRKIRFIR